MNQFMKHLARGVLAGKLGLTAFPVKLLPILIAASGRRPLHQSCAKG